MPTPPDRFALLDRLIHLHDDLLAALEAGNAPDLDAFDADRESAFVALRALSDDGADAAALRARLEALSERTSRAMAALAALRDASGQRLAALEQGQRGLRGYKTVVAGGRGRGARLGEG